MKLGRGDRWVGKRRLLKLPIPYYLSVGHIISCLLTMFIFPFIMCVNRFLNVIVIVASFNQALSRGLVCDCENFVDIRFQL